MPIEGYFPHTFDRMSEWELELQLAGLGLLDPVPVQLWNFLVDVFTRFDFGESIRYRQRIPVGQIIGGKAPISLQFGLAAVAIGIPLGMALGVLMARKTGGAWDKGGTAYIATINALPAPVYFVLIQLYGSDLINTRMLFDPAIPSTRILPIFTLILPIIATNAMWMRRYMVDEINKDYIKLARAKGVPSTTIFFRHVFRNAVVPMTNTIPITLAFTIVGSIIVESLYSIPGTGGLLVNTIRIQDNPLVLALVVLYSTMGIFGLFLGDMLMALVDPRIRLRRKGDAR